MARFIFIVVGIVLLNRFGTATECDEDSAESSEVTTTSPPKCGDNEILDNCPVDCPSDYCPKSLQDDQSKCSKPDKCPPPACKCGFNSRRVQNGTCIPTRDCPPFKCKGLHEEYNACPSYCPGENCSQATADGKCHLPGRLPVLECKPACRCKKNYWRLNGNCVPYKQCPKQNETSVIKCGPFETMDNCPVECPSNYCPKSEDADYSPCPRPKKCPPPKCVCSWDTKRNDNGSCVPIQDCPPFECPRPNEEYRACYPEYPGEDCSQAVAADSSNELKSLVCKPACRCKKGFWRLNGACVPYEQCNT